ncbi:uncharacterized mitochondrial protein AtMg00860-like [Corylus avellana]|uniref:uncharacterized mitochondrial protein AtMg00860-like n=1 Tax=Corylus avellana TaxID=13451 RepID=UPI00286D3E6B|nr:uncharacterized mitochondrial protein AtMg00860-like [Corylus avellana]
MILNLGKCAFGVFLGFMVSQRGIEANPEKIRAIIGMQPPRNSKELQRLTRCHAALNRFISQSINRSLLFFKILRKPFEWNEECEAAFQESEGYLMNTPLLNKVELGEPLYVYRASTTTILSSVLIRKDQKVQKPIYYTSRVL